MKKRSDRSRALQIVPIAERYIAGLRAAVDSVARERRYITMFRAFPIEQTRQFVRSSIRARNPFFVAVVERRLVGWCDIQVLQRDTLAHSGILGMGVINAFRGQGIGAALMRATLGGARNRGLARVELTVREDNRRAIALYRRFGFVREGVKRNGFRVDGRYYDLLSMAVLFRKRRSDAT